MKSTATPELARRLRRRIDEANELLAELATRRVEADFHVERRYHPAGVDVSRIHLNSVTRKDPL